MTTTANPANPTDQKPDEAPASFTQADLDAAAAKAREAAAAEAKTAVEAAREEALKEAKAEKARADELAASFESSSTELNKLRQQLQADKEEGLEGIELLTEKIRRMDEEAKEREAHVKKQLEEIQSSAEKRIAASKLEVFRERAVGKSKLREFGDLVTGNTEAEIKASIEKLEAREARLSKAGDEADRKRAGDNIPPAGAPAANRKFTLANGLTREQVAALPRDEYLKYRQQLVANAVKA